VRYLFELQHLAQFTKIVEQLNHAAKIGFEKLFENEDGKQLGLGEPLWRILAGVRFESGLAEPIRFLGDRPGRFGHGSHNGVPPCTCCYVSITDSSASP